MRAELAETEADPKEEAHTRVEAPLEPPDLKMKLLKTDSPKLRQEERSRFFFRELDQNADDMINETGRIRGGDIRVR